MRVIDNREKLRREVPDVCPECGGAVHVEEVTSRSWESVKIPQPPGGAIESVTVPGSVGEHVEWHSLDWWCSVDREHDVGAPIALAQG